MGYLRNSFSRFRDLYEKGNELALVEISKAKPNLKNCVTPKIEAAVMTIAVEQPASAHSRAMRQQESCSFPVSSAEARSR
jgi:phosphoribosylformylglycinamidine (FGAM) synthase-like amidotransferase family enzyme